MIETIGRLLELRVEIPIFQVLESSSELANQAGMAKKQLTEDDFAQNYEYLQLLREQNKLLCSYLSQNNAELGLQLTESLFENYFKGGVEFAKRQSFYTITRLLD